MFNPLIRMKQKGHINVWLCIYLTIIIIVVNDDDDDEWREKC